MTAPRKRNDRAAASEARRREILDAALALWLERGYDATTIPDIVARARASTGSVYHHFKSKEQLFGALYLEGVRRTQEVALRALAEHRSTERAIRAVVATYLVWVSENPDLARFLLTMRRSELTAEAGDALARANRQFGEQVAAWWRPRAERGELPGLRADLWLALLIGPSDHFARQWLRGETRTDLRTASRLLADAAWQSLGCL
jgi:AcrR family transcriptional regulator